MIETRLLDQVAYGTLFAREYSTEIVRLRNGVTRRNAQRSRSIKTATILFDKLDPTDHAAVIHAFEVCDGGNNSFRVKDWSDYAVTAEPIGNTPGANQTPVQLYRTYTFGGQTKTENITKPVSGTVTVYSNGVAKAGSLDTSTGLFTPTTNWTAGQALTWTGEFDRPMRFASDRLAFTFDNYAALTANVELEEDLAEVISPT